jgi:TrmH family RNA methyltransferase
MITSVKNPMVKQLKKLHQAKGRREENQFLIEGTHLLQESLAVGYSLDFVCCTAEWQAKYPQEYDRAAAIAPIELVSDAVLGAIATTVHPDGVVAVAPRRPILPSGPLRVALGLERLQDPGNLGTIVRAAAAAGADRLWIDRHSVDVDHPKVLRSTAGQWFRMPMQVADDLRSTVRDLKDQGVKIVATLPSAPLSYWEADLRSPVLVLLGNEGAGLSPELTAEADTTVSIPLAPGVESLNVAVTAALLLYEIRRQQSHC